MKRNFTKDVKNLEDRQRKSQIFTRRQNRSLQARIESLESQMQHLNHTNAILKRYLIAIGKGESVDLESMLLELAHAPENPEASQDSLDD